MSRNIDSSTGQAAKVGYTYWVNEQQLAQYAALTILERLMWLDQARQFVLLAETDQSAARRAWLRNEKSSFSNESGTHPRQKARTKVKGRKKGASR